MLNTSEQFVKDHLSDDKDILAVISHSVELVHKYSIAEYSYSSKTSRLSEWLATSPNIPELIYSIFITALLHESLTLQAMCGMLNHKIQLPDTIDRVKTIAEILAVVSRSGLINIIRQGRGENTLVRPGYRINVEIPVDDKHELNRHKPQLVVQNHDDVQGSLLLGGSLNHHNDEICLAHINRMNAIPLSLNVELLKKYEEMPTFELDTPEKAAQWKQFKEDSIQRYLEIVKEAGNKFYLTHKYDTRGRCYATGYHVSTQGTSFKKAIVQLHKKEVVTNEL